MRLTGVIALVVAVLVFAGSALADVLIMKDGRRIEGIVLEVNVEVLRIESFCTVSQAALDFLIELPIKVSVEFDGGRSPR